MVRHPIAAATQLKGGVVSLHLAKATPRGEANPPSPSGCGGSPPSPASLLGSGGLALATRFTRSCETGSYMESEG